MLNEADTRVKLIDPKRSDSGWTEKMIFRENPKNPLPNGVTTILVPEGPCISEGEDVVDW